MDYKSTINLPKTPFPMKANLPQNEPKILDFWSKKTIYQKMVSAGEGNTRFTMPDGPPYANGNIHLGHTLNKVLKDIVIKYKNMSGHSAAFIPGWDCHGLPIELKVAKALGKKKAELSDKEFRQHCRDEAKKWVNTQREQFKRLGILADWDNPYLTLNPEYEAEEVRVLAKIFENGILVRGEKPVYWCPALQTALAAAEVEYQDHTSPSIYVKFFAKDSAALKEIGKPVAFVIWTTTPWTLPANYAIALNPSYEYGVYDTGKDAIILAKDLAENVMQEVQKHSDVDTSNWKLLKTFKGKEFEGLTAQHPFIERDSQIILGDHVTLEAGTGCVHTAPGHGLDDYQVGLKYNLPVSSPVDKAGRYTNEFPEMEGVKIWEANKLIVEKLVNSEHMLTHSQLVHSYPHNPRSNTPLIFRATPQWFIKMDDKEFPLRQKALSAVESKIEFVPKWGAQRLNAMLSNSPDWCISRQRLWGVPIPVFYCGKCEATLMNSEIMNAVADKMDSSKQGIEAYFEAEPSEFLPANTKCSECGHTEFTKGQDILDVWFDSGICHTAVQKKRDQLDFPADIYLEGSDQHRGWFQTSLTSSIAAYDELPFKALITHGFVNDSKGHKMSKSKGNTIDPLEVIKKSGAEILRLWVAYEDYGQDLSVSQEIFQRVSDTYRRIRNTTRFMLGNLNEFDVTKDLVAVKDMPLLDQWAMHRLNELIKNVTTAYESYNFYKVYHLLNSFYTVDLSSVYLDVLKDRLYTWKADGNPRRSSQTVIYHLLTELSSMMAPILSFLSEEVNGYLPGEKPESIFMNAFPKQRDNWSNTELADDFEQLLEVRSAVSMELEQLRQNKTIGSSLDAQIVVEVPENIFKIMQKHESLLRELFIVSAIEIKSAQQIKVLAKKADGEKCVRCWHWHTETGKNTDFPDACPKCVEALS